MSHTTSNKAQDQELKVFINMDSQASCQYVILHTMTICLPLTVNKDDVVDQDAIVDTKE